MCRSKMATDAVAPTASPSSRHRQTNHQSSSSSSSFHPSTSNSTTNPNTHTAATFTSSSSSISSRNSLSSLRNSLPDNPHLYDISEIRNATNNFLSKNTSSSSSTRSWRCNLHNKDVIIFQRKSHHLQQPPPHIVRQKLSSICKSHHVAVVNLAGASLSGDFIYLVYDFVNGASVFDLLHNRKNPDFTVLNTWMSRMQITSDLANGLDYIHNNTGLDVKFVHNHIKSTSVIVTEPSFNAKICHFGTAELCGEPVEERENFSESSKIDEENEIVPEDQPAVSLPQQLTRSNSVKFSGTRGYMAPEFQVTGFGTRKSDVYAFGVVLLELLSGQEPLKYKFDKATKEYLKISIVDYAKQIVEENGDEKEGRLRKWVDRRLKDSFPVDVAEKLTRLAVDCVHVDPEKRPDMRRVAGKISRLYLESQAWCDRMRIPTEFTVSFAPR